MASVLGFRLQVLISESQVLRPGPTSEMGPGLGSWVLGPTKSQICFPLKQFLNSLICGLSNSTKKLRYLKGSLGSKAEV